MQDEDRFGAWVRRRRRALDLSQQELARRLSCARITVQKIEAGERRPSSQLAALLAEQLAVPAKQRAAFLRAARSALAAEELEPPDIAQDVLLASTGRPLDWPGGRDNLPAAPLPCIGREQELARIAVLLADPTCRLITVTGFGGVGKTRLALAAAQTSQPADGVRFIPLAGLPEVAPLPALIAEQLGLALESGGDPLARLGVLLHRRQLLLVLDNAEHLLPDIASSIAILLSAAPGLRLIVTSRERIRLQGEHLVELRGLTCPPEVGSRHVQEYGAAQLFLAHVARVHADLKVSDTEAAAVGRICRTLAGLPLALILAAGWARLLDIPAIAEQIAGDPDLAALAPRELPARHQGLRAVFAHSWALLPPEARRTLTGLAVFHGPFSAAAAQTVAAVGLHALATLLDASLLERATGGRYALHPLVRQFAYEQLEQDRARHAVVQKEHSVYYTRLLNQQFSSVPAAQDPEALAVIGATIADVRAAWRWAVDQRDLGQLAQLLDGIVRHCVHQGWLVEGVALLGQALTMLGDEGEATAEVRGLIRRLQLAQASCYQRLAMPQQALQLFHKAVASAQADQDLPTIAEAWSGLGSVHWARGEHAQARRCSAEAARMYEVLGDTSAMLLEQAALVGVSTDQGDYVAAYALGVRVLAEAEAGDDPLVMGIAALRLSLVEYARGDYAQAHSRLSRLLAIAGAVDQLYVTTHVRSLLGLVLAAQGNTQAAEQLLAEAVAQARALNYLFGLALALNHLGDLFCRQGRDAEAYPPLAEALALCEAMDNRMGVAYALTQLGEVARLRNDMRGAKQALRQSLELSNEMEALPLMLDALVTLSLVAVAEGQHEKAAQLREVVLHHQASRHVTLERARRLQIDTAVPALAARSALARAELLELAASVLSR